MKIYADTSVLFSLYVTDANSPRADAWRQSNPVPLDFTGFHRVELRNALGLAVFQQRLTPAQSRAAWQEARVVGVGHKDIHSACSGDLFLIVARIQHPTQHQLLKVAHVHDTLRFGLGFAQRR